MKHILLSLLHIALNSILFLLSTRVSERESRKERLHNDNCCYDTFDCQVFWRTRCFPGVTLGSDMEEWWGMASEERCFQGQPIVDQLCDCSEHVQVMHRHHHGDPVVESLSIVVSQREKERERKNALSESQIFSW